MCLCGQFRFFCLVISKIFKIGLNDSGSALLPIYDKFIWPLSKLLDNLGLKYLFGKNLLLLAKKP